MPLASCDNVIYLRTFGAGRMVIVSTPRCTWTGNADPFFLINVPVRVDVYPERFELDAFLTVRAFDANSPSRARILLSRRHDIATFLECE